MVTIPRKLNMDHLEFHLISESGKKNGKEWNKQIQWSQAERKKVLWCFMYIKEKTLERTIRKHTNCGDRNPMT